MIFIQINLNLRILEHSSVSDFYQYHYSHLRRILQTSSHLIPRTYFHLFLSFWGPVRNAVLLQVLAAWSLLLSVLLLGDGLLRRCSAAVRSLLCCALQLLSALLMLCFFTALIAVTRRAPAALATQKNLQLSDVCYWISTWFRLQSLITSTSVMLRYLRN